MKTISKLEYDVIVDVRNEGLTPLPPSVFEKDLLVAEVLKIVADSSVFDIQPVFCGGTCLSQAYQLIQRMSEDIDFKLIVPEGLSRNARSKQLKNLNTNLSPTLLKSVFMSPSMKYGPVMKTVLLR